MQKGKITWQTPQSTRVTASSLQEGRHQPSPGQHCFPGSQCSPPNSNPSRKDLSQEGSNSQSNHSLVPSQAGNPLPQDSVASQEASTSNNSTLSREGPSQEGSNPQDSMASQEASTSPNNSTLSRESPSQEGSNPPSSNSLVSSQAGNNLVSTQAVRFSTRLRASQADRDIPQQDSEVSWGSQAVRCSFRHRASQPSQENGTTPQASRASSQGGNTSSPTNSMVNNNPQGSSMEEPNPKWVI